MSGCTVDLSIIVTSYNTRELLRGCLKSIYDTTQGITFEVIVTDDCSSDGTSDMVRELFPQVKLTCNPVNLRYAKNNNNGLRSAKGRYGLLLDSDTVAQHGAFAKLVKFMDEHPDVAAAGPKLINPDGSVQDCIRGFPGILPIIFQSLNFHRLFPGNSITDQYYHTGFDYSKAQAVDHIGTSSYIIRRSTWEKYGMLDERFTLAFVDNAYNLMLKQNGQKVYYVPDSVVKHYRSQTINVGGLKEIRLLHQALRTFYDSYYAPEHNFLLRGIVRMGIHLRQQLKLLEFRFSSNKNVFGGAGLQPRHRG